MSKPPDTRQPESEWLPLVRKHVGSLRYGVIQVIIHDSRVTQIECTEKIRFQATSKNPPAEEAGGSGD